MKVKIYHNKNFLNGRKIRLQQEEIHIWCIRWGEIIDFLKEKAYIMDCQEKEKAAQYRFYEDRMRYMAGKICTRILLMRYLNENSIVFLTHELGKTYHKKVFGKQSINFNISHSGEIVLLVFAFEMKVGIDVQKINEYLEYKEMANNFFSPVEAQDVNCGNIKLFFQYWSAKEAYLKALGIGLGNGMDFFSVKGNVIEENGIIKHEWKLIPITIKNYAAYVAVHEGDQL